MAKDPYKYFRIEAREILEGLTQGILELESGAARDEVVARLRRLAHTLKGAARVVKQLGISETAHAIEDLLAPAETGPNGALTSALLRHVDAASSTLSALESPSTAVAEAAPRPTATPARDPATPTQPPQPERTAAAALAIAETVRIEITEMDAVLEGIAESSVRVDALRQATGGLGQAQLFASALAQQLRGLGRSEAQKSADAAALARSCALAEELLDCLERGQAQLVGGVERVERELFQLQEHAGRLRLVAANTLFAPLTRAVRDAAQATGTTVAFEGTGGDTRLDAHVLSILRDALLHVVRNAVAHGIETASERAAAGKPACGRIELRAERRGNRVAFVCRDDGRGIDLAAVRRAGIARGLLSPAQAGALDLESAGALIFEPGVSTSTAVTAVSGRGVGLDVVRDNVLRLKGDVRARSEPGRGTTIEITVPISLSSLAALAIEAAGRELWIPLEAVARTARVTTADIARSSVGDAIFYEGRAIPFLPLPELLANGHATARSAWSVVIVRGGETLAAIGVDHLRGVSQVMMRPLPKVADHFPLVAGATLDPEGIPQLVLDPLGLATAAIARKGETNHAPVQRPPILVVDDSLTTRMLEQSILESAGYEVELAVSAEEGLRKARDRRYSLFLVDVEMPGMNGFEFVARTKDDPGLRDVPAILVTSLDSAEHRRQGLEAGARAYLTKGDFDEGRLRQLIRDLVG